MKRLILRNPRKRPRNQTSQIKRIDPWAVLIIKGVRTLKIRRIEEESKLLESFYLKNSLLTSNRIHKQDLCLTERMNTGGRSSGSVMQIKTESGRRSGGRERRSASGVRTKIGGKGGNGKMRTRSRRKRLKGRKIVPWRRERVKTLETPLTLRGWGSLPKKTRRRRVVKESGCEIR